MASRAEIDPTDTTAWDNYREIDEDAKWGNTQLVRRGETFAAAYWTGELWAYRGTVEKIDFEPTHYFLPAHALTGGTVN